MRTKTFIFVMVCWLSLVPIEACQVTQLECRINMICTDDITFGEPNNKQLCQPFQHRGYYNGYDYGQRDYDAYRGFSYDLSYNGPSSNLNLLNSNQLTKIQKLNLHDSMYDSIPDIILKMENLKYLILNRNALTQADFSNLKNLNYLEKLDLSNNLIDSISGSSKLAFNNLKFLNMSYNSLNNLPKDMFHAFPELFSLDLSYNEINSLDFMSFNGIKHLKYLNLTHNKIFDLNLSLLRIGDIEELDLSYNKMININAHEFKMIVNLNVLDLSHNLIVSIDPVAFKTMHSLSSLDLSYNNMEALDKYLFKNLSLLQKVDLSYNQITEIYPNTFKDNNISFISLTNNNLNGSILKYTFQGLSKITELDLSFQGLTTLDDYAFIGLDILRTLLLNNNELQNLPSKCFQGLDNLNQLDLSNNKLVNINFESSLLTQLYSLDLSNNYITHISTGDFTSLTSLEYLNLSNNSVSNLKSNSFENLFNLVNLNISGNPLNGSLHKNTFVGLSSLPSLDISKNMLKSVENGSFSGMDHLNYLKLSYGNINEIQYNAFIDIYNITYLDLSYNQIEVFVVNTTSLENVQEFILHNNLLTVISFERMYGLKKVILSNNKMKNMSIKTFKDQKYLQHLDLSQNGNLTFDFPIIQNQNRINKLILSGIINKLVFTDFINNNIEQLDFSNNNLSNVTLIDFHHLGHLKTLNLTRNTIKTIQSGDFVGLKKIRDLVLSYNKIEYIQPGSFIDNSLMLILDISYNNLKTINYGVFSGLINLKVINLSYNRINTLKNYHFSQVSDLNELIVDHNEIDYVSLEYFKGTKLKILSVGDNPITCDILFRIKENHDRGINITALKFDYNTENVDGITCNRNRFDGINFNEIENTNKTQELLKAILLNLPSKSSESKSQTILQDIRESIKNTSYLMIETLKRMSNLTISSDKFELKQNERLFEATLNQTTSIEHTQNKTNELLYKIIEIANTIKQQNAVELNQTLYTHSVRTPKNLKLDLDDSLTEIQDKINQLEDKIRNLNSRINKNVTETFAVTTMKPINEKLSSGTENPSDRYKPSSFLFIETCVALILLILVCFILYKFYNSKLFMTSHRTLSRRDMVDSMENTNL